MGLSKVGDAVVVSGFGGHEEVLRYFGNFK